MRKILFLDFDGVLHPDGAGLFSKLGLFEEYLSKMPEAELSSVLPGAKQTPWKI
jgi:hypothetical protein